MSDRAALRTFLPSDARDDELLANQRLAPGSFEVPADCGALLRFPRSCGSTAAPVWARRSPLVGVGRPEITRGSGKSRSRVRAYAVVRRTWNSAATSWMVSRVGSPSCKFVTCSYREGVQTVPRCAAVPSAADAPTYVAGTRM